MAAKRNASPLESEALKKKMDFVTEKWNSYSAWISTEGTVQEPPERGLRSSGKIQTKTNINKQQKGKSVKQTKDKHESDMATIVGSLKNLESLYGSLDKRVSAVHSDLDMKLDRLARDQSVRFEKIENLLQDHENKLDTCTNQLKNYENRIGEIEAKLRDTDIEGLKLTIRDLESRLRSVENKPNIDSWSSDKDEYDKLLYGIVRKQQYHDTKFHRHERKFLDVNVDLKEKYMSIGGIPEDRNEDLLSLVLSNINNMLGTALTNPIPITREDIDMVYRTGKFSRGYYPRQITVIFVRKGLKQFLIAKKKGLGWDPDKNVTYSEDLDSETRNHREALKSVATASQNSDHNVKIAGNRIYVNGKSYGYEEMDILPAELRMGIPQTKRMKEGLAFRGKECYLSNFYPCELMIDGELYVSVEQYYQYTKAQCCEEYDRAEKIMCTDDPLQAKVLGDGCEEKRGWLENKVYTMFKGMFYKFAQNDHLAYKLMSTEDLNLYEATTDRLFGAGIGINSKKWEMNSWEGKNVCGKLLVKIRHILKKKVEEGLVLNKLIFNYSLPSLRDDPTNKHYDLFFGGLGLEKEEERRVSCNMSIGRDDVPASQFDFPPPTAVSQDEGQGNLTELLATTEKMNNTSQKDESSLFTLCDRAVRRQSHSVENPYGGIKQRNNPTRQRDSLTRRERVYISKMEEDSLEDKVTHKLGFDRSYGLKTGDKKTTSTPISNVPLSLHQINKAQRYLLDYLDLDVASTEVQKGLKTKSKADTPIPGGSPRDAKA